MLISHHSKSDPGGAFGVRSLLWPHLSIIADQTVYILQGPAPVLAPRVYPPPLPLLPNSLACSHFSQMPHKALLHSLNHSVFCLFATSQTPRHPSKPQSNFMA